MPNSNSLNSNIDDNNHRENKPLDRKSGGQSILTEALVKELRERIEVMEKEKKPRTPVTIKVELNKLVKGNKPPGYYKKRPLTENTVSRSVWTKALALLKLRKNKGELNLCMNSPAPLSLTSPLVAQRTTEARSRNEADPANLAAFAASEHATRDLYPPELKINLDFTSFLVVLNKQNEYQLMLDDGPNEKKKNKVICPPEIVATMKFLMVISAGGYAAEPLLIIQDTTMDPEKFRIEEILGLSHANIPGAKGSICVMKTRGGNDALFQHIYTKHLPNFINSIRNARGLFEEDGTPMMAEVSQDGEALALNGALADECWRFLIANRIDIKKLCASCSAIQQPCDVGKIFLAMKTILGHKDKEWDAATRNRVYPKLRDFVAAQHGIKETASKAILAAIPLIIEAMQRAMTCENILTSFKTAGIVPFSIEQMFNQSSAVIDEEQRQIIIASLDYLGDKYLAKGKIKDKHMRKVGILFPQDNRDVDKDQRALQNQRIASVTHNATHKAHHEKKELQKAKQAEKIKKSNDEKELAVTNACDLTRNYNEHLKNGSAEAEFFKGKLRPNLQLALKGLYSVMEKAVRPAIPSKLSAVQADIMTFYSATEGTLKEAREKFRENYSARYRDT